MESSASSRDLTASLHDSSASLHNSTLEVQQGSTATESGQQKMSLRKTITGSASKIFSSKSLQDIRGSLKTVQVSKNAKLAFKIADKKSKALFNAIVNEPNMAGKFNVVKKAVVDIVSKNGDITIESGWKAIENDWRANEKYDKVMTSIQAGFTKIAKPEDTKEFESIKLNAGPKSPESKCAIALSTALDQLSMERKSTGDSQSGDSSAINNRDRYKLYKECFREALSSKYYTDHCQDKEPPALVNLLNSLAAAEFTAVEIPDFTESIPTQLAASSSSEKTGAVNTQQSASTTGKSNTARFREVVNFTNLDDFHNKVGNEETLGQKIRGEVRQLGFDASLQGNPPNVKCRLQTKGKDGKDKIVTDIRTPTPTGKDGNVTPEFKAFLRHLKSQDPQQHYTMFNLQNRTKIPSWKKTVGLNGENVRSRNLEKLSQDDEFKGVIDVFTLDKNSAFYFQKGEHAHTDNADKFKEEFMEQLFGEETGFNIPERLKNDPATKEHVKTILENVHNHFFDGKPELDHKERENFIEISYLLLVDHFVHETGADYFNTSCKDCIDRGGGANWLLVASMTLKEAHAKPEDPAVREKIDKLPAKLEEDAVWARKRGLIHERLERAEGAVSVIADKLEKLKNQDPTLTVGDFFSKTMGFNFIEMRPPQNTDR